MWNLRSSMAFAGTDAAALKALRALPVEKIGDLSVLALMPDREIRIRFLVRTPKGGRTLHSRRKPADRDSGGRRESI